MSIHKAAINGAQPNIPWMPGRESQMPLQCCQRGCQAALLNWARTSETSKIPTYTLKPQGLHKVKGDIACTHRITPPFPYNKFRLYYRWHGSPFAFSSGSGVKRTRKRLQRAEASARESQYWTYFSKVCLYVSRIFFHAGELRLYERKVQQMISETTLKNRCIPTVIWTFWSYCTLLRMHVECKLNSSGLFSSRKLNRSSLQWGCISSAANLRWNNRDTVLANLWSQLSCQNNIDWTTCDLPFTASSERKP